MRSTSKSLATALAVLTLVGAASGLAAQQSSLVIGGTTYTKWLWGTNRQDGSLYNFTTVPGEGLGDNGQGSELELLISARVSKEVEVKGRIHSRFSQNQWTNFGGFGGFRPLDPDIDCTGGDCGEFDPRSNQYIKLRGVAAILTPGYRWIDSATIGSNDFGQFDPFVIGRIRYIDRDNASGLLFQGSGADRRWAWDATRISLPRLWAGPRFNTGEYTVQDAAYGLQGRYTVSPMFDFGFIGEQVSDIEVDNRDLNRNDGRDVRTRFENTVLGFKFGVHPSAKYDVRGAYYASQAESFPNLGLNNPDTDPGQDLDPPANFFGISGFSPVPAGDLDDPAWKVNVDLNDPFERGLSVNFEVFDIGAQYVSMMAARREADVLLTEGFDATFAFPGPTNTAFGVFSGENNRTRIGYGGWQGTTQQVPTINVDNEFTDFDEPLAWSVIGWKGFTVLPTWSIGNLDLAFEYTFIDYNTNWQAWDDPSQPILSTIYPNNESDTGVLGSFRNAYAPFQEKETDIALVRFKYLADIGKGVDLFGKFKIIDQTDERLDDPRFLPFQAGDCPGGGQACANNRRFYGTGPDGTPLSTADLYGNPGVITGAGGQVGYQWAPFDDVSDDDRDLDYQMFQLGAGYQLTDDVYGALTYELYDVDLLDGNTAFQSYQLHEMVSGQHTKNKIILTARYILAGAEVGFNYEYAFGTFEPDFGGDFVPVRISETDARNFGVEPGTLGFFGRFGGFNSIEDRDLEQQRIKAFMKIQF